MDKRPTAEPGVSSPFVVDGLPLSASQMEIWLAQQLSGSARPFTVGEYIEIDEKVDIDKFRAALEQLVIETDALHVRIVSQNGEPRQVFGPPPGWTLGYADVSAELDPTVAAEEYVESELTRPMDLEFGPLFAFTLLRIAPNRFWWLHRYHHIIVDGLSMWLLARRTAALYSQGAGAPTDKDKTGGSSKLLLEDDVAYRSSVQFKRDKRYWAEQVAGAPSPVSLTGRTATSSGHHIRHSGLVPLATIGPFLSAGRVGRDVAELAVAVMATYLARLANSDEVVLKLPVRSRSKEAGLSSVVGMTANLLPLRIRIDRDTNFRTLIHHASQEIRQLLRHQMYRGAELYSNVERGLGNGISSGCSINVMAFDYGFDFGSSPARVTKFTRGLSDDLTLVLYKASGEELQIDLFGNSSLYSPIELETHHERLTCLLQAVSADPDLKVGTIDVLLPAERRLLLEDWNRTDRAYASERCVHQLFEEQVSRNSDAAAVEDDGAVLSYRELNARANRLAHQLIELGVGPDKLVAICVERSPAMVVGLLAVLKAGGAYVPLDPSYPADRLAWLLGDAAPMLVLADAAGREAIGAGALSGLVALDLDQLPEDQPETDPVVAGLTSNHLAYVIYTSGSTGQPKGVMVEHRSVVRLLEATHEWFRFDESDVWTLFHSFAFDFSVWELWGALRYGGRLVIVPKDVARSPEQFHQLVCKAGVTVLNQTPSAFRTFIEADRQSDLTHDLRHVIFGGEALEPSILRPWYEKHADGSPQLVNMYGITETTVHVTYRPLRRADAYAQGSPIGQRIPDLRIYVVDAHGAPMPLGVPGELWIGGAGVARGYLNRLELTAERFVPDRFGSDPDARLYRTGDLARWLPDGNLEFLGRNDEQVKIRGFRIEPGEIAARLAEHAGVRDAVVIALGEGNDKRLVAYVVPADGSASAGELRDYLAARLPDYMVPSAYVQIEALPLTPNGKLDRRALPAPDADALAHAAYEAPQGEIETALAAIWSELLGIDRISRNDSFFALGGHSLLAVRLLIRLTDAISTELPLAELFANPTLAGFARAASDELARSGVQVLPEISRADRTVPLELSHAQERLWFLSKLEGVSATYHIPRAMRLRGQLNEMALRRALDRLWARHEAWRYVFNTVDGSARAALLSADAGLPLMEHDLRGDAEAEAHLEVLCTKEATAPFDLSQGPLVRGRLIRLEEDDYMLLLTQHHIVSDGWSVGVLVRELEVLYAAYVSGQPDPLPELPVHYPDYAAWQRRWLSGARRQTQVAYWRAELSDAPAVITLPTDRPRPAQQDFKGASAPIAIDAALTSELKRLSLRHGTTLFVTVLAAWSEVLARLSGQDDIVVGTPVANRSRPELEGLIGFFVNMLALRIDTSGSPNKAALLERVRETVLGAQSHQDLPFEQVVEIVQPPRRLGHTPVFQVMLAWNEEKVQPSLAGLAVDPAEMAYNISKFDLELALYETVDGITGSLRYATALFDAATIERHIGYLVEVLRRFVTTEATPLRQLDILSPAERRLLLEDWNRTDRAYASERCVHQLFEEQVSRNPDAAAVEDDGAVLSYRELNARANRLAHQLIELGVGPDKLVAICVERSPAMVVGLLAVLKAGGAYVPLDPSYPADRLAWLLGDAAPMLVLADAAGREAIGAGALSGLVALDLDQLPEDQPETDPVVAGLTSNHLAYVIYTSGSTGQPKGVMVEHRSVVRLVTDTGDAQIRDTDRLAWLSNPAFDLNTFEMWAPLVHGAVLVVVPQATVLQPVALRDLVQRERISVLHLTSGLFSQAVDVLGDALAGLRLLMVGGDVVDPAAVDRVLKHYRPEHLLHCYGPTESTTFTTICDLTELEVIHHRLPIGRPISNTKVYVLDAHGSPMPLGVPGELWIGGAGVARGYLNRPDLTAERFVPDRFGSDPDARLYRTGDLARWLPDGNLEFLGRNDEQVKIRGFRIEPGEIAARLAEHAGVRDAVVIALGEGNDKRLVAYVVPADGSASAGDLRDHLATRLPDYMVPSAYVQIEALPLTPNGKLDRRALPAPDADALAHAAYEAPQGEIEIALAAIWSELLGIDRISRNDSFFALGGHSLLAVRLLSRTRTHGFDVAMEDLYQNLSLKTLARWIGASEHSDGNSAVTVREVNGRTPIFFVPTGFGDHSYVFELARELDAELPIYVLPWPTGNNPFPSTIQAMAKRMASQLQEIQPTGPYRIAGYSYGGILAYAVASHLLSIGEVVSFVGLIDSRLPAKSHRPMDAKRMLLTYVAERATSKEDVRSIDFLSRLVDQFTLSQLVTECQLLQLLSADIDVPAECLAWDRRQQFDQIILAYDIPVLSIKLVQFYATEETVAETANDDRPDGASSTNSSTGGWDQVVPISSITLVPVPGDHITMMTVSPNRKVLAEKISQAVSTSDALQGGR